MSIISVTTHNVRISECFQRGSFRRLAGCFLLGGRVWGNKVCFKDELQRSFSSLAHDFFGNTMQQKTIEGPWNFYLHQFWLQVNKDKILICKLLFSLTIPGFCLLIPVPCQSPFNVIVTTLRPNQTTGFSMKARSLIMFPARRAPFVW